MFSRPLLRSLRANSGKQLSMTIYHCIVLTHPINLFLLGLLSHSLPIARSIHLSRACLVKAAEKTKVNGKMSNSTIIKVHNSFPY